MILLPYEVVYYQNSRTKKLPAREFIFSLSKKVRAKVWRYIDLLVMFDGYLDEPYSRHIDGDIRELRVDFGKNRHRIFYFTTSGRRIILLSGYYKKTDKTPRGEIERAQSCRYDYLAHQQGIKYFHE